MTNLLYAAEYVLPGHPDKLCDAIADSLVEEAARREQRALVAIEVGVHRGIVFVTGRVACNKAETIDIDSVVRAVYTSAGYGGAWYPDASELKVVIDVCLESLDDGESEHRSVSDDQCTVTGYAIDIPGTNFLPPEHWLASRLAARFERLRLEAPGLELGPDGKLIAILQNEESATRLISLSASLQQSIGGPQIELHRAVSSAIAEELTIAAKKIPGFQPALPDEVRINGAGSFAVGGPDGDNGLSGKKLVVDAYGPRVPIGGGALSGKDFYKPDRAGAIMARRLAKAVVMTGVGEWCISRLAFFPGSSEAKVLSITTDRGEIDTVRWESMFDLSLVASGDAYARTEGLVDIARHGHFTHGDRPWERLHFAQSGAPNAGIAQFIWTSKRDNVAKSPRRVRQLTSV